MRNLKRAIIVAFGAIALSLAGASSNADTLGLSESLADPFDEEPLRSRWVPDEIAVEARNFMIDVLLDDVEAVAERFDRFKKLEKRIRKERALSSGLEDNLVDLYNTRARLGDAYIKSARKLEGKKGTNESLKHLLRYRIEDFPYTRAEKSESEDRFVKWGRFFNRLSLPAGQFAFGNVLSFPSIGLGALGMLNDLFSYDDITVRERQALFYYRTYLERYPNGRHAKKARKKIKKYEKEARDLLHKQSINRGTHAYDQGAYPRAVYYFERAVRIRPDSKDAKDKFLRAKADQNRVLEGKLRTLDVRRTALPDGAEAAGLDAVILALIQGEPERARKLSKRFRKQHKKSDHVDDVQFADAMALAMEGRDWETRERLSDLADLRDESSVGARAYQLLRSSDFHPYGTYERSKKSYSSQKRKVLFMGARANMDHYGVHMSPRLIVDGPAFLLTLAQTPSRMFSAWILRRPMPVSKDGITAAGEAFVRRYPDSKKAKGVHKDLEGIYKKTNAAKAYAHWRARKGEGKRHGGYENAIAKGYLEYARQSPKLDVKYQIYQAILKAYPKTDAAKEASAEMSKLLRTTRQRIRLSKAFLKENRILIGQKGLNLRPELFDGERSNREMAEQGITLVDVDIVQIAFEGEDGEVIEEFYRVRRNDFARFISHLDELGYRKVLMRQHYTLIGDSERDYFFEEAKRGEALPGGRVVVPTSTFQYLSDEEFDESHGYVFGRPKKPKIPIDLVFRGSLEDFSFSAFPRIRLPDEPSDAFLYR